MRQRFYSNTIQSKFIQQLLTSTYLPICDTIREGDYAIKGYSYVYKNALLKCTESGCFGQTGVFKILNDKFYWNTYQNRNVQRFYARNSYYDSYTHEWLGKYLRCYRDVIGIDLMPFYNCFSGIYTSKFFLQDEEYSNVYVEEGVIRISTGIKKTVYQTQYDVFSQGSTEFNTKYNNEDDYKVIQVPVMLNRKYTIAIDCDTAVSIAPAFINNGQLVKPSIGGVQRDLTTLLIDNQDSEGHIQPQSVQYDSSSFIKPILYELKNNNQSLLEGSSGVETGLTQEQLLQRYQRYLYLLIQVPRNNESSIVVLEGDYTECSVDHIIDMSAVPGTYKADYRNIDGNMIINVEELTEEQLNKLLISKLSLLQFSDKVRYPFSDRLMEYLLLNVIDNQCIVGKDINNVQYSLGVDVGIAALDKGWTESLRYYALSQYKRYKKKLHLDNNGNIDKDVETIIS